MQDLAVKAQQVLRLSVCLHDLITVAAESGCAEENAQGQGEALV